MSSPQTEYDVIIIGAGLSALQAARTIQQDQPGSSILLLEARDRVGGRAHTLTTTHVDVGCSMLHGYYQGNPGRKLLKELGIQVHIPQEGAKGLVYGDEGPLTQADANSLFSQSTQMAYQPNPDQTENGLSVASLLFPTLLRDNNEVGEKLIAIARTGEIGAGIELEKTSARWAGYEKGIGGTDAWPIGGYSQVVNKLATEYESHGGHLQLSQIVTSLTDDPRSKTVKLTTRSENSFISRYVISTIPLSVLQKQPPTFSPSLSPSLQSAISRTLVGNLEKIVLTYSSAWWPHSSTQHSYLLLPLSTASHPPSKSATAPAPKDLIDLFSRTSIPIINLNSSLSSSPHPTLLAYIGASSARHLSRYTPESIASNLHSYLISRFSSEAEEIETPSSLPIDSHVTNWSTDPFSLGATSTPSTLTRSENGEWSNPLDFISLSRSEWEGRLGWAGEHTVLDNHGSVTGALESGEREGRRVGLKLEPGFAEAVIEDKGEGK